MRACAGLAISVWLSVGCCAQTQTSSSTFSTIYNFPACTGTAGSWCTDVPPYGLTIGSDGVLYGVTGGGGTYGYGTVFSLTPPSTPDGAWTEATLYSFTGFENGGHDGIWPVGLVAGSSGVLYGTTAGGGSSDCSTMTSATLSGDSYQVGCGVFFSLTPPTTPGGKWSETVLALFIGGIPDNIVTGGGMLYGTASPLQRCEPADWPVGGTVSVCQAIGLPFVFSLTPPAASGSPWTVNVLYDLPGSYTSPRVGWGGLLYVAIPTAEPASDVPAGQILSLSPPATGGGQWTPTVIYSFAGIQPGPLAAGSGGVLYGTNLGVLPSYGEAFLGTVGSLTPPTTPGGSWARNTLYTSSGESVGAPVAVLAVGNDGTVYVETVTNGCSGWCGTLFSLTPPSAGGGSWTETTLHSFDCKSDGCNVSALVIGNDGFLYGATMAPGPNDIGGTVFRIKAPAPQPSINPAGGVNAASYAAPVAPGSIAAVFGSFFVPVLSATRSPLPDSLSDLSLQFDMTTPVPLVFVSEGQVNFQVPWELAGHSQAQITATRNAQTSAAQTMELATFAPAIFTTNAQGTGQGAILDESNRLVDTANPATPGSTVLQIFCTGLGPVTNQPATGSPAPLGPFSYTTMVPTVTVGGLPADVSFYGLAPGYVGLYQINALVPSGVMPGNAVPVLISMQGAKSNTVTIAVE